MLLYQIRIALKSLRRSPVLTALLIAAIAVGICVSTTFVALRHMLGKDPLPGASLTLYHVRLDSWGGGKAWDPDKPESLPTQLTWKDAQALMRSRIPAHQTATYIASYFVFPEKKAVKPYSDKVRLVGTDFFTMFRLPFRYGGPWGRPADEKPEQVAIIDDETNQKLDRKS